MRRNGSKVLIIVLVVIAVLAIVGGIFAYLYFGTDTFKSNQELFARYLVQNMNEISQTVSLNQLEQLEEKLKQNNYEESIAISYAEEEGEEPIGQLTIDTQNDPINKKNYGIIGLSMEDLDDTLEIEYMKEDDTYSIRFTNSVKQFLSIENKNLKQLAEKLGMKEETIDQIPNTIDLEEFSLDELRFTEEEKQTELNKYSTLLYNNIAKEKYTKTRKVLITVNGKTITTNAYILTLDMQDLKTLGTNLLETLKQDEIILSKLQIIDEKIEKYSKGSIKESFVELVQGLIDELNEGEPIESTITITVYEQDKKTVRIKAEQGLDSIILDTIATEGKTQINLNYTSIDEENTQLSNGITFIKENNNKLTIQLNTIEGEEQQWAKITAEVVENGDNVKLNVVIDTEHGQVEFSRNVTIVSEINYAVTLSDSNNYVLNKLTAVQVRNILAAVGEKLKTDYVEPLQKITGQEESAIDDELVDEEIMNEELQD